MKLFVVNCEHYDRLAPTCRVLGAVDFNACETCEKRAPLHTPYEFGWTTIDVDDPPPAPIESQTIELCRERLREEWGEEWQEKLKAAAIATGARTITIPASLYVEAMRYRK